MAPTSRTSTTSIPSAPIGGTIRLGAAGTFDSFNPYIIKGNPAAGAGAETLLVASEDEPFTGTGSDRRDHRMAGRSLLGRVYAAARGALARRPADHRGCRVFSLRNPEDQGPAVLPVLLRYHRPGGEGW